MLTTETVFVRITLKNGQTGIGETAPFYDISGEDRVTGLEAARVLAEQLLGQPADRYRFLAQTMKEISPSHPAARCGLEIAILDAFSHSLSIPLWALWGGRDVRSYETDITIPITDLDRTLLLAGHWYDKGFRLFKLKVGRDLASDVQRLDRLNQRHPDIKFIIDPNQGFSREQAITFAREAQRVNATILLYEQPLHRDDLEGQVILRQSIPSLLAADESVRSVEDLHNLFRHRAADYINIKIMKCGVIESVDIAIAARSMGLGLMIGGMVETRLAMGCSFSLVLGLGGFTVLDLDTPLLLTDDPVNGGFQYEGPNLRPWHTAGLGMSMNLGTPAFCVE